MKKIGRILLALLLVFTVTACSSSDDQTDQSEGTAEKTVVAVMESDIGDISPFGATGAGRNYIRFELYETLGEVTALGQTIDTMPLIIAKSVEKIDGKTMRVTIYDYVQDSQGNPITASDVVFSYESTANSGNYAKVRGNLDYITAVDDYTVEIGLTTDALGMMEYMLNQVPIVSQAAYEASSAEELATNPIATGPYVVTDLVSGSRIVLEKNTNYWQTDAASVAYTAKQPVDKITFNVVTEAAQRTIALETQGADIVTSISASEISHFLNADGTAVEGYNVATTVGGLSNVLMFNVETGNVFDNLELRQAVAYAIDQEAILQGALNGAGEIIHDFATSYAGDYNEAWDSEDYYDYDLDKAKTLLVEAGYEPGELSIRIMVGATVPGHQQAAQIIQANLSEIGIETEILSYDNALFSSYKNDSTQWDIILDRKGTTDFVINAWKLAFDANGFGDQGTANFIHDDTFQDLLAQAAGVETHSAETVEAFHDYMYDQAYAMGLFITYTYVVGVDGITDIVIHPKGQLIVGASEFADDYQSVVK